MDKIALYCKSFSRDIDRVVNLVESIHKFNADKIPVYISVPSQDVTLFYQVSGNGVTIIEDEDIYDGDAPGWIQQQIVKSNFWKLELCENYVCIDSDGYFIKDFYISDFMYDDETPYTVIHEQKELFTWTVSKVNQLGFDPKVSYISDRQKIMDLFGRTGKYYDFGPVPTIWSGKVWKSLEDNYITPNNLTWEQMLEYSPSEFSWYGESLLAFKAINIYPCEPIFKVFHYAQQLQEYIQNGITQEMISQNYLGIIMQSNFNANLKY
jgi:hypothetical protein